MSFQRIKLRRVQTAAVGLCRGVYVFIGRVAALAFQRFMLRRVQTAAVGLCRGVYVFIGRVHPVLRSELYLIIHAEMPLRLFMDFSAGSLCISKQNATISQAELYPILHARHYPSHNPELPSRALQRRTEHFRGCLQTPVLNPPKADFSIRCACNQTKVCRRKGSGRRLPNESVPTEGF